MFNMQKDKDSMNYKQDMENLCQINHSLGTIKLG